MNGRHRRERKRGRLREGEEERERCHCPKGSPKGEKQGKSDRTRCRHTEHLGGQIYI